MEQPNIAASHIKTAINDTKPNQTRQQQQQKIYIRKTNVFVLKNTKKKIGIHF